MLVTPPARRWSPLSWRRHAFRRHLLQIPGWRKEQSTKGQRDIPAVPCVSWKAPPSTSAFTLLAAILCLLSTRKAGRWGSLFTVALSQLNIKVLSLSKTEEQGLLTQAETFITKSFRLSTLTHVYFLSLHKSYKINIITPTLELNKMRYQEF